MEDRVRRYRELGERFWASMSKIKHKVVILSGKGGVGKSMIAANLAIVLVKKGHPGRVGILDADITGPSIPKILGLGRRPLSPGARGVLPPTSPSGVKVISMDLLLRDDDTPVTWRGPLRSTAIRQFIGDVAWGDLDYLLVDLPPGTGDEALSTMRHIPGIDGVIIITTPSEVSQMVVRRAVTFIRKMNVPIIGVLENMSRFVCPNCGTETDIFRTGGGERIASDLRIPFLGKIPLDPRICEGSDRGLPSMVEHQGSAAAKAFASVVSGIEEFLLKGSGS
jgi:ATP-binding protein involved in chromosome partitioning